MVGDRAVGLLGLKRLDTASVAIVCFRIDPEWQRTAVVRRLFQVAYSFCQDHHCQVLLVGTGVMPGWSLGSLVGFWGRNAGPPRKQGGTWLLPVSDTA